jgi:hypothetical protein
MRASRPVGDILEEQERQEPEQQEPEQQEHLPAPPTPVGAAESVWDEDFPAKATATDVTRMMYTEARPYGAEHVRHGYLSAGDVLALVVQSREGTAPAVPFQQTVALQSRLLA